jgi:hypothetical protein
VVESMASRRRPIPRVTATTRTCLLSVDLEVSTRADTDRKSQLRAVTVDE